MQYLIDSTFIDMSVRNSRKIKTLGAYDRRLKNEDVSPKQGELAEFRRSIRQ